MNAVHVDIITDTNDKLWYELSDGRRHGPFDKFTKMITDMKRNISHLADRSKPYKVRKERYQ